MPAARHDDDDIYNVNICCILCTSFMQMMPSNNRLSQRLSDLPRVTSNIDKINSGNQIAGMLFLL